MMRKAPLRSILGGAAGNLVEWFDWYVYSAFSLYFAKAFFPGQDQTAQFLATSGIFWIGFLMRPIGGWLLGRIGDRHGRRTALAWSVALMGGGSLLLAATPTYASVGLAAPVLLMVARIIQGLSLGGEYGAAATYLSEIAPEGRRGLWSSFQYVTLYGGQLLALALLLGLRAGGASEAALSSWGWRLAFVVGAALAFGIYLLRRGIDETPDFAAESAPQKHAGGIADLWANHRRSVLIAFGLAVGSNVAFYTYTTYMQKYLVVTSGFAKPVASQICAAAIIVTILLQPVLGGLSDRIGRKPLIYWFALGGIVGTVPLMSAIGRTHDALAAFALLLVALVILSGATATSAIVKAELFPPHVRALGVGLPYALSQSLFGGSAEAVALRLKQVGHESLYFWYVTAMIGVALVATVAMRNAVPGERGTDRRRIS
jgi:MHS family alpha-ketoglutarate permease-like MFS transporter